MGPTTAHVTASSPAIAMVFSLPAPPDKAVRGPTWGLAGHQGQDVALSELLVAVEKDDRTKASRLAHPPQRRPADAQHFAYLFLGKQALLGFPLPIPEGARVPAAGQDGLPVVEGQGLVEFQGGFDEAMEGGEHRDPYRRKVRDRQGAGTAKSLRHFRYQKVRTVSRSGSAL